MKWFWKMQKVIALTGNNAFSVKKLLSVDDLTTNYLVYSPCVYNRPDDNWLLDVELYSEEFRADLISIWMDEMGLISNPAMRNRLKIIVLISMRKTVV